MALTPIDVQQKTFGTALRGYDLDEVDDFLDEVVTSLKGYEERLVEAQERIAALQAELEGKGDSESAISRALVTAQRSADALVAEAQTDAARIRSDAQVEADRVLEEARVERARLDAVMSEEQSKLDAEVSRMRQGIAAIRSRVLDLNTTIGSNLDDMEQAVAGADLGSPARPDADEPLLASDEADSIVEAVPPAFDEVASDAKWYEAASEEKPAALDLGLDGEDQESGDALAGVGAFGDDAVGGDATTADATGEDATGEDAIVESASSEDVMGEDLTTEMTSVDEGGEPTEEGDALDDAIAEATFASDEGDQGWEEPAAESPDSWEEVWGSEDEDRPRRPWE